MDNGTKNNERRKFLREFMVTCLGALCLGGSKKATAADGPSDRRVGRLYRRTRHVDEYLRTLED